MTTTDHHASDPIASIKTQLEQLKEQHQAGTLTDQAYNYERIALERGLLDLVLNNATTLTGEDATATQSAPVDDNGTVATVETPTVEPSGTGSSKGSRAMFAGVILVAIAAGGVYFWLGNPNKPPGVAMSTSGAVLAAQPFLVGASTESTPHAAKVDDISSMADKLAARLQKQPNDPQGWAILARSYDVLGNLPDALKAYANALELLPDDANLKADYEKAKAKARSNEKASVADVVAKPAETTPMAAAPGSASISGTVTLSPALKKNAQPEDTLFVLARPQEGSRMPLAILRKQVKDLPLHFVLDDSMSMTPVAKISSAGKVVVMARISKSGNAVPALGDLSGQSAAVVVGAKDLKIEIDTLVKP